jgi:hypothetical protein
MQERWTGRGRAPRSACLLVALAGIVLALAAGCGGDDSGDASKPGDGDRDGGRAGRDGGSARDASTSTRDAAAVDAGMFAADEPLSAPDLTWTWVDFPNTQCRNGSTAGIALSLNGDSDKLMIYLEGGGACFDGLTCVGNPDSVGDQRLERTGGLFARGQPENPVADWNHVFVPYCTGDVHAGTNPRGVIPGLPEQRFVGRLNLEKFLLRIVPTFPNASQVLLTGVSAGGFGAAANTEFVQRAFGDIPVTVIDDSGPPMSTEYLPECLQARWRQLWGFEESILADCGADCPNPDDYSIPYTLHVAREFPDRMGGLIETTADSVITLFYGYGTNNCTGSLLTPMSAEDFTAGLLDYRATVQDAGANLGTYFVTGSQHTWLGGASLYTQTTGGVRMIDWVTDIIEGRAAEHVGP